ncbi:MAG: hypothetical protein RL217_756 [Pseudomonadota bacterium]|jgi:hypothetical protein
MPKRALFLPLFSLLLSACAVWPKPEPEQPPLTRAEVRELLQEQAQQAPTTVTCELPPAAVEPSEQEVQLAILNEKVEQLLANAGLVSKESCPQADNAAKYDGKLIIGATEWVYLNPPGHHYLARIDSGATTSSISVLNLVRFERNGKKWVKFDLKPDGETQAISVEAPVERNVLIRQSSTSENDRRPVVLLNVRLGSLQQETEFTLTDRSHMNYPMLLGRSFLQDVTLIDVSQELIQPKVDVHGQIEAAPSPTPAPLNPDEKLKPKPMPTKAE